LGGVGLQAAKIAAAPARRDDLVGPHQYPARAVHPVAFANLAGGIPAAIDRQDLQAIALVARERKCSVSFVQRYLQIGYNRAARIVERMEKEGVVTPANHVGKREILARDIDDRTR